MVTALECIVSGLKAIPDVVWSGVIAALIALSGVWASNKGNNERLRLQLAHDAAEKSKERIHALRSDVYLGVVEYIEITNIHLSSLSSRDLAKSDMSPELQAIAGVMAKLKLVAEPETSRIATELGSAFGTVFLKLISCLMPLQQQKVAIEINSNLYHELSSEVKRIQGDIDRFIQDGEVDYIRFQALQSALDFKRKQSEKYSDAMSEAHKKHGIELLEFNRELMMQMKFLTGVQLKLMIATRKDLGLDSDSVELLKQLELQWNVMQAAYKTSMASIND